MWNDFFLPVSKWTGGSFIATLKTLTDGLAWMSNWIKQNPVAFRAGVQAIIDSFFPLPRIIQGIKDAIKSWTDFSMQEYLVMKAGGQALVDYIAWAWGNLSKIVSAIWLGIVNYVTWAWGNLMTISKAGADYIAWAFGNLKIILVSFWNGIVSYGTWAFGNLTLIVQSLQGMFLTTFNKIGSAWNTIINGFVPVMKSVINTIVDLINFMLGSFVSGINSLIGPLNAAGSMIPGWSNIPNLSFSSVPHLATGAVIPPNNQFLAVLGDQKSGTNIEAPAKMIEDIVTRAVANAQGSQNMTVTFDGRWGPIVQELFTRLEIERTRRGGTLIAGGISK